MVVRARSFIVRMDRSTSPTWSSAAVTLSLEGRTSFQMHSNSMSACKAEMLKPLDLNCQNRLDLTEEGCFVSVEYGSNRAELNFARDSMKKGVALDVEMSIQSVTSLWCCKIKLGTCTGLKVGTCWEGPFVVFLLRAATSGPYMSRARLASSTVTGQFRMRFLARICSNCC